MREKEPDCVADISSLKELGYIMKYSWETGLRDMIQRTMEEDNESR